MTHAPIRIRRRQGLDRLLADVLGRPQWLWVCRQAGCPARELATPWGQGAERTWRGALAAGLLHCEHWHHPGLGS